MLIFVCMMTLRVHSVLFLTLYGICGLVQAQFSNNLENQKTKPMVSRSFFEADSAHYRAEPRTTRDKERAITHWVWTEFDKYKSPSTVDSSYIIYARSVGDVKNRSEAFKISHYQGDCMNGDATLRADAPAIGLEGNVYVVWAGPAGVCFQRSLDSGLTWMPQEKIITPIINGWEQNVNGREIDCTPKIAFDTDGAFKGRIYITWSDEKNGEKDKDVFLIYSDDKGDNWTDPILITYRGNHKEQYAPNIMIQPKTGKVLLTYFDRQNYNHEKYADIYLGMSSNGGLKFYFYKLNNEPMVLDTIISPIRGIACQPNEDEIKVVWSQLTPANELNIYSVLVNDTSLKGYSERYAAEQIDLEKTLKFSDFITLHFDLKSEGKVSAAITKPLDPKFNLVLMRDEPFVKGPNILDIDVKKLGLKKDNYIVTLYYKGRNNFAWILK